MSTFSQDPAKPEDTNAKASQAGAPKDTPTKEEISEAEGEKPKDEDGKETEKALDPNDPVKDESHDETLDRHVASTELEVGLVTDPATQSDTPMADAVKGLIVPGAASGPDFAGTVRNDEGKVAYALPGTMLAAQNGVQQDAAGHVDSIHTDNSSKSGTRV